MLHSLRMGSPGHERLTGRRTVTMGARSRFDEMDLDDQKANRDMEQGVIRQAPNSGYPDQRMPSCLDRTNTLKGSIRPRIAFLTLLLLSAVLYLGTAASPSLLDDDVDAAHALVAREMLQRHDFVVMYMDGIRYLIRPPLHFWMVSASYALLGESAFATRLPVALAMMGLVLLVYEFGRRFFDERTGFYGALVVATSAGMFIFTRVMLPEALYALEFTAAFYLFLRSWTGTLETRVGYWGTAACCALGMLTRGPIGALFPMGAIAVFITLTRSWRRWRELHLFSSVAVFLALAAPWHILAALRAPGFLWQYFLNENVYRAFGARVPHDYGVVPLWLWWIAHLAWFFPWSVFALFALRMCPPPRSWGREMNRSAQVHLLLFVWAGFILLFFSIEHGSRMEYYSFGAWPAIALLLGSGLAQAEKTGSSQLLPAQRALAALGAMAAFVLFLFVWTSSRVPASQDASAILQRSHSRQFYWFSMAPLLDFTSQTFAGLRTPALLAAFSLAGASIAACILRKRQHHLACNAVLALGMVGFFYSANIAYKAFEPVLSSRALAIEINKNSGPGDQIAIYGDIRVAASIGFYTHRRLWLYNASGSNLEYGSHYPDAPEIFLTDADFPSLWNGTERVFLVAPKSQIEDALKRLPRNSTWALAEAAGKVLCSNRPGNFARTLVSSEETRSSTSDAP
jgi:4-amino-4-deoxy-L-arabinose transferase-like glycosyltransferase